MNGKIEEMSIPVLLVEQEPEMISVVSLFLSEIKECKLSICSSGEEALLKLAEPSPAVILFAHGLLGQETTRILAELRRKSPNAYVIVSFQKQSQDVVNSLMVAGANDCVCKDKNYVPNLVQAVKKAFIRIAERDLFELPSMAQAECFAIDENLPDIVFTLDLAGNFLYVNKAVTPLLGYEQKALVGTSIFTLLGSNPGSRRFKLYIQRVEYELHFRGAVELRNILGLDEEFEIDCSFVDADRIYGVARKELPTGATDSAIELPDEEIGEEIPELIPARLDHYRIVTLLGAGAVGRVYRGFDEQLERHVAIKVLGRAFLSDKDNLERFRKEAKILASISHPNIALIYHFGSDSALPFFCMEYLQGGSIETLLQRSGVIDPDVAASHTMQVALGLTEALVKGVIHLDIKPSNLMIAENERIKIVDFGLARTNVDSQKDGRSIAGTPCYVAPEQIQGKVADHRSDIYSLGITFFQMLYGFLPFTGETIKDTLRKHLYEKLPPFEKLDPAVPKPLYDIVCKMTARDPNNRYLRYADLILDLERYLRISDDTLIRPVRPSDSRYHLSGFLYDRPFAEILGEIAQKKLSGKLILTWIDVTKTLHFKEGNLVAVLSSQEGESFTQRLLEKRHLTGALVKEIQKRSSGDLLMQHVTAISEVSPSTRRDALVNLRDLAIHIIEGLFRWEMGQFVFDEGDYPRQIGLELSTQELVLKGVKEWVHYSTVQRRLQEGKCQIDLHPDFQSMLLNLKLSPADVFLLFRFDRKIGLKELRLLSGLADMEFYRLIYLFFCLNIIRVPDPSKKVEARPA